MAVTEMDIRKQVRRLLDVFGSAKPEDTHVAAWKYVFEDEDWIENIDLMPAVSSLAKAGGRFMPNAGQVLREAKRLKGETGGPVRSRPEGWDQRQEGPCPVCGAVLRLLTPEERGQTHVFDTKAWKSIEIATLREMGAEVPPSTYGVLHDLRQHERAGVPAIGYAR